MNRASTTPLSWISLFCAVALVTGYAASATAQKAEGKMKRSRLPNHYAKVVTEEQRSKINAIQEEFVPQIDKLRDELDATLDKRDAAIEKVLTPEQRKEVEKLRAESQARRKGGDTAENASEGAQPKGKSKSKKAA
jgi:TolA-binding protein